MKKSTYVEYYSKNKIHIFSYFIFICLYAILISRNTNYLNPIDEMTIPVGIKLNQWHGIMEGQFLVGRFQILNGLDIFIIKKLFNNNYNIILCYIFISIQFLFTSIVLYQVLYQLNAKRSVYIFCMALILSPGFTSIYFRLLYTERYLLLIFIKLVHLAILILCNKKNTKKTFLCFLILINIGMYFKEIVFIPVLIIGIGFLLIDYKNEIKNKNYTILGWAIIVSVLSYIIFYYMIVSSKFTGERIHTELGYAKMMLLSLFGWLINDPLIILLFIPITIKRIYVLFKQRLNTLTIYDVFGIAGFAYILSFFILKLYAYHYFVPIYAFVLPVIIINKIKYKKAILIICFIIQLGNLTIGINDILFQKYEHKNFDSTVNTISTICKKNYATNKTKTNLYILGGHYFENNMFFQFMHKIITNGNPPKTFDLMTFEAKPNNKKIVLKGLHFNFMEQKQINKPKNGDYIIYTPYTRISNFDIEKKYNVEKIKDYYAYSIFEKFNFQYLAKQVLYKIYPSTNVESKSVRNGSYRIYKLK